MNWPSQYGKFKAYLSGMSSPTQLSREYTPHENKSMMMPSPHSTVEPAIKVHKWKWAPHTIMTNVSQDAPTVRELESIIKKTQAENKSVANRIRLLRNHEHKS